MISLFSVQPSHIPGQALSKLSSSACEQHNRLEREGGKFASSIPTFREGGHQQCPCVSFWIMDSGQIVVIIPPPFQWQKIIIIALPRVLKFENIWKIYFHGPYVQNFLPRFDFHEHGFDYSITLSSKISRFAFKTSDF